MKPQNMYVSEVRIQKVQTSSSEELSDLFIRSCSFCNKKCDSKHQSSKLSEQLSGDKSFYCNFCIRHGHNFKSRKNILILSFRPVFAQFYYCNFLTQTAEVKLYLSEIQDMVESHRKVGLLNPAFTYDPESMLWFVDFSKIGKKPRQLCLTEVYKTILNIIVCFNLWKNANTINMTSYFTKFKSAVDEFYTKRYRPKNKKICMPTLNNCGNPEIKLNSEKVRNFCFNEHNCSKIC